ncbi:homoserine dehydrogenase, partial [Amylibacter sp.]|nr:homoserine dehydrogenase [Amylibacter sp.]
GGIPVIKALTESLAGNNITRIMGVMNGTCNYILTRMEDTGLPYEEIFEEANQLGFLEADPNLDVGGIDAAHKLVLLSSIAYGTQVDFEGAVLEGIGRISIEDIRAASEMGYRIKLLGVSTINKLGLSQTMRPCLVPASSPLAQLDGGTNMIIIEGDAVGQIVLRGAGAGEGPTASAVIADILDIARGINIPVFGQPANSLKKVPSINTTVENSFYLRLNLKDEAGILAKVSAALANAGISIDRIRQEVHETDAAPVIIVTHPTERDLLNKAIAEIEATSAAIDPPVVLRIETV